MKEYTFKQHPLTEAEKLWLKEVASNMAAFDPRIAKIKLLDKLPRGFNPNNIDRRLLSEGKNITLIGLRYINPEHEMFISMDNVIRSIRDKIFTSPGISKVTSEEIAENTKLDKNVIEVLLYRLGSLGTFFSSATTDLLNSHVQYSSIELTSLSSYDSYIEYENIDEILERNYVFIGNGQSNFNTSFLKTSEKTMPAKKIKPNTAFILMAIDNSRPELEDVYQTIKSICKKFGITAYRADEIEHQDRITDLILSEIDSCEFLIADLSYERPNVYYEIGYAHALEKRPILYRRTDTKLHFDLAGHNVPGYRNATELGSLLTKRLEAMLGRTPKEN